MASLLSLRRAILRRCCPARSAASPPPSPSRWPRSRRRPAASAFCGFYVAGADAKLFNNATMVVLMREGTRTVLSMQNNYQGPPGDFAMVVPVPVVLQRATSDARRMAHDGAGVKRRRR